MQIEHKIFEAEIKESNEKDLTVTHFISTETKDRGGDIMRAAGMKIRGKPVVLMAHGRGPMGTEPIAKPVFIQQGSYKGKPGVMAKTQFFPDEIGKRLWEKTVNGYMPNWSIGYSVIKSIDIDNYRGRDVQEWELLEYSPVGVPMNPDAQTIRKDADENEQSEILFKIMPEDENNGKDSEDQGKKENPLAKDENYDFLISKVEEIENKINIIHEKIMALPSLPASPDAEIKGEEDQDKNPPDKSKVIPRLRIVDDEGAKAEAKAKNLESLKALIKETTSEVFTAELNKLRGKVP